MGPRRRRPGLTRPRSASPGPSGPGSGRTTPRPGAGAARSAPGPSPALVTPDGPRGLREGEAPLTRLSRAAALGAVVLAAATLPAAAHPRAPQAPSRDAADRTAADQPRPDVAREKDRAGATRAQLHLPPSENLVVRDVVADGDGTVHVRYDRTFHGLRVVGGDLVVTRAPQGDVENVRSNAGGTVAVDSLTPTLSRATARGKGATAVDALGESGSATLVVYAAGPAPRLAFDVLTVGTKADQTPTRTHTFVDARDGAILERYDEIADGTGSSTYSGTVTLTTTRSGGTWRMEDPHGNLTTDLNGTTRGPGGLFTDPDDVWGNGSASSRQTAAVDAQYGAEQTYAFYTDVLGRAGIWNTGEGARSRVHYGDAYGNAFWDGTQMTYGDGIGNTHPLTELDVAGHEMSHGVTENTAGLVYSGDAGGLNEATSDILGTAVEFHANNSSDVGDYLIGEEIDLNGNGTPLRYMDRPSKDGLSPDCWSGSTKDLDPHYSSGPLNHWFFLASEGSGAHAVNGVRYDSPTCDGSSVTGVGRTVATKVWYRTLTTKLTSTSTYPDARDGAIASAKELYGAGSSECTGVERAFTAISVTPGSQRCGGGRTPPPRTSSPDPPTGAGPADGTSRADETRRGRGRVRGGGARRPPGTRAQ